MSRTALFVFSLSALLSLPGLVSAQIRMTRLDEVTQQVTIENFSASTGVDISGYFMCRAPGTYRQFSTLTIVGGGDLDLSPGESVTIIYTDILSAGTGIGVYVTSGFTNPANMSDYMQFKGVAGFRESVAVDAGLWTAGTFATGDPGPYFYTGDGVAEDGAAFWTNSPPAVPALSTWGLAGLVALFLVSTTMIQRRRGETIP
jgi:hypothetical protein